MLEFTKAEGDFQNLPEECFKRKLIIGSCKLQDPKQEKPTNFEVIMPVILFLFRRMIDSFAII